MTKWPDSKTYPVWSNVQFVPTLQLKGFEKVLDQHVPEPVLSAPASMTAKNGKSEQKEGDDEGDETPSSGDESKEEEEDLKPVPKVSLKKARQDRKPFRLMQLPVSVVLAALKPFAPIHPNQDSVLIVDLFAGTGSAGIAAQALGCSFAGMDSDPRWTVSLPIHI